MYNNKTDKERLEGWAKFDAKTHERETREDKMKLLRARDRVDEAELKHNQLAGKG